MSTQIDRSTWPGENLYRLFRGFDRPQYQITTRLDASALMASGLPVFRTAIWALGAGLHAVPALRLRFEGDVDSGPVTLHDRIGISPTIAQPDGSFAFTYLDWHEDRGTFDAAAAAKIEAARKGAPFDPDAGGLAVSYFSCLPWLDYTSLDNALPHKDDCIPRISWGKIVPKGAGFDMAVTLEAHHALVDGRAMCDFFEAAQTALAELG